MSVLIREITLDQPEMAKAVIALATTAFGPSIRLESLRALIEMPEAGKPPLCLGAFHDDELTGFLGCTPHRFIYHGAQVLLYQPAWAVTSAAWRGKGIFTSLIQHAKEILKKDGAGGMFASPNPKSGPVFTGPLGFNKLGALRIGMVLATWGIRKNGHPMPKSDSLSAQDEDLFAWQGRRLGTNNIKLVKDNDGNQLWARKRSLRKLGITIPYWLVGGVSTYDPAILKGLLKQLKGPALRLFFYTDQSASASLFRFSRLSKGNYLVWKSYGNGLPDAPSFNCMMGVFDHF